MSAHKLYAIGAALLLALPATGVAQHKPKVPDTLVISNGARGPVKFTHGTHSQKTTCVSCHHESRPAKAKTTEFQKCSSCHTKPATAPMTAGLRDAFHNPMAKQGTCIDCHVKEAAAGKAVPVKCSGCHAPAATP